MKHIRKPDVLGWLQSVSHEASDILDAHLDERLHDAPTDAQEELVAKLKDMHDALSRYKQSCAELGEVA